MLIGISLVFTEIIVNEYCTNVKVLMCDKRGRKLKVELEQHSRCFFLHCSFVLVPDEFTVLNN